MVTLDEIQQMKEALQKARQEALQEAQQKVEQAALDLSNAQKRLEQAELCKVMTVKSVGSWDKEMDTSLDEELEHLHKNGWYVRQLVTSGLECIAVFKHDDGAVRVKVMHTSHSGLEQTVNEFALRGLMVEHIAPYGNLEYTSTHVVLFKDKYDHGDHANAAKECDTAGERLHEAEELRRDLSKDAKH